MNVVPFTPPKLKKIMKKLGEIVRVANGVEEGHIILGYAVGYLIGKDVNPEDIRQCVNDVISRCLDMKGSLDG